MRFFINPTENQEKTMFYNKHWAIEVKQDEIQRYIHDPHVLPHLKRVKQLGTNKFLILISQKSYEEIKGDKNLQLFKVDVPAFQPETEEQIEEAQKAWPVIYKKDNKEIILPGCYFTIEEDAKELKEKIRKYKTEHECVRFCKFYYDNTNLSDSIEQSNMLLENFKENFKENLIENGIDSSDNSDVFSGHILLSTISDISKNTSGYLCTGMSLLLDTEPCYSCAMALVHGRVLNVFIAHKRNGGIFSKYKFNHNKNTNHRFNVYFYN